MSITLDFLSSMKDDMKVLWKKEMNDFKSLYDVICKAVLEDLDGSLTYVSERLKKILDYNVAPEKFPHAGMFVCVIPKMLSINGEGPCDKNLAFILGWCIAMIAATIAIADDMMDNSYKRYGKPCWFRLPEVGVEAVNDARMLEYACYRLLRKYFSGFKSYEKLVQELNELLEKIHWGQSLDMKLIPRGQKVMLNLFTMEHYRVMTHYKSAALNLPFIMFMHMTEEFTEEQISAARNICEELNCLMAIQNDHLDIYGSSFGYDLHTINCDIQNGKCTWFIVKALEVCTEEEKLIIEENYGVENEEAVQKVVDLYNSLALDEKYQKIFNEGCEKVSKLIGQLNDVKLKNLFNVILFAAKEPRFMEEL